MNKIKVLVANRPRLMRGLLLATISEQPDIEIVAEVTEIAEIERVVAESKKTSFHQPCLDPWNIQFWGTHRH